jgi:hypothetical protein
MSRANEIKEKYPDRLRRKVGIMDVATVLCDCGYADSAENVEEWDYDDPVCPECCEAMKLIEGDIPFEIPRDNHVSDWHDRSLERRQMGICW